jgi:hypothetical protein
MHLAVLNPGGNDPAQQFPEGAGSPSDPGHAPVNYHAYAACTAGRFHRKISTLSDEERDVLLVLRWDLKRCTGVLRQLKAQGRTVAVSLKESGLAQVARVLEPPGNPALFQSLCAGADGCLTSTPELVPICRAAGAKACAFIPTPYPVDDSRWDFSRPLHERIGVFIGTREFDIHTRNHAVVLLLAREFGLPTTVINPDGRLGRRQLAGLDFPGLRVIEGPLPFPDYLRLMASHRIVLQLDRSAVPGQVAGDALLCRTPCIGGDGAVDRLAFPELCGVDAAVVMENARRLLGDDACWHEAVARSQAEAAQTVSFRAGRAAIAHFFSGLRR